MTEKEKWNGFGSLSPERQKEIARSGGLAAQASGKAHRYTSDEAKDAGRKGGVAAQAARRAKKASGS